MRSVFFLLLLLVLMEGCINPQVKTGNSSQYELPGFNNTTIFYLNISSTQVIENINNRTSFDYQILDNINTFKNPVAVDYSGNNASFNVSIISMLGRNYAHFNFSSNFSGYVAYSLPGGQDFTYSPPINRTIRVILPVNYTAGTMFLGYMQPKPDNITHDPSGREVIIWNNASSENIRVKYNQKENTQLLVYFVGFLLISTVIIWGYYKYSISAIQKKRKMLEKDIRKLKEK
ncbi:MAG: DUF5803 family protein [Candidatus Methanoperedens sp.]|nr:DUF5803 family protein [Candidatus Methanoperedens sp.]